MDLPTLNACLNAATAGLLLAGFLFIRRHRIAAHRACMLAACATSVVFLVSYLLYHSRVGTVRFTGQGWIRPVYFAILISHSLLAAAIVPMAILTLLNALRKRFDRHKVIARWTLPTWLYVSVTGIAVYGLLYLLA